MPDPDFEKLDIRPKSRWGGSRVGSGRKPTIPKPIREAMLRDADRMIVDRLPELIGNLMALADGILLRAADKPGDPVVYATAPDRAANVYLLDRILGKPTERHEHGAFGGEPLFPPELLQRVIDDPHASDLACQLDEALGTPPLDHPGGVRPPGQSR